MECERSGNEMLVQLADVLYLLFIPTSFFFIICEGFI